MPKIILPLSAAKIRNTKPTAKVQKLRDGNGLMLVIHPHGRYVWVFEWKDGDKYRSLTLGDYPQFSLAEARDWRESIRGRLARGLSAEEKNASFHAVFDEWFARWQPTVTEKYAAQIRRSIIKNIMPSLGEMEVTEIRRVDVVNALRVYESRGVLAYLHQAKFAIKQCLDYAVNSGYCEYNFAANLGRGTFKPHQKTHFRALPPDGLPELIQQIETKLSGTTQLCAYWQLMTMCRPREAAETRFDELDLQTGLWVLPIEKTKRRRLSGAANHVVPLVPHLLELLEEIKAINFNGEYLFDGYGKAPHIYRESVGQAMRREGFNTTAHGFRALARTYLRETRQFSHDALEMCLSHAVGDATERAYSRSLLLEERREILTYWTDVIWKLRLGEKSNRVIF
ncbi:integrase arm-type DNA-binding domain-containing protein [Snodgrassella sp. CFCC 13594]|uniref:tyrosine-type recombinase/integrase n=1 Tax=Snodgrassella sp. CFCC 13594 TaxID=1775559 RepID=UPI000832D091|nr:integrase arm-type DNA-binding domain-containing protein [Snodgrassella sp. CFCC 13594]